MGNTLFGDYVFTESDVADKMLEDYGHAYKIEHTENTKQGFKLTRNDGILKEDYKKYYNIPGCYAFYKKNQCVYVGFSNVSIGNRISRFVKELNSKCTFSESHSAAKKYKTIWGSTTDGLTIKIFPYPLSDNYDHKKIETYLIMRLNPLLNNKVR
jgi:hypothetical protein